MTIYTRAELDREAKVVVRDVQKTLGGRTKLREWSLLVDSENTCLCVDIIAGPGDGYLVQRHVAI